MAYSKDEKASFHRSMHKLNHGGLHRALGVPEGQPIPKEKIASAQNSDNPHVRKMAQFAHNAASWGK